MEKVKKLAPMVGLTLAVNVLPTCLITRDVFPTPVTPTHTNTNHQGEGFRGVVRGGVGRKERGNKFICAV